MRFVSKQGQLQPQLNSKVRSLGTQLYPGPLGQKGDRALHVNCPRFSLVVLPGETEQPSEKGFACAVQAVTWENFTFPGKPHIYQSKLSSV